MCNEIDTTSKWRVIIKQLCRRVRYNNYFITYALVLKLDISHCPGFSLGSHFVLSDGQFF